MKKKTFIQKKKKTLNEKLISIFLDQMGKEASNSEYTYKGVGFN